QRGSDVYLAGAPAGGTGLLVGPRGLNSTPDAPEEVHLPERIEPDVHRVESPLLADEGRQLVPALARVRITAGRGNRGEQIEACQPARGPGCAQIGTSALQILVGRQCIIDQPIQPGIVERCPEFSLDIRAVEAGLPEIR